MTTLIGDLQSIMGTPFGGEGHAVLIFSRVSRAAFQSGAVITELHDRIPMPEEAGGRFTAEGLDPGPIRVELEGGTVHGHGWNVDLPEEGEWHLADLMDAQVEWSPAVVGRAESAARDATQSFEKTRELRDETEGFRDETFQKADAALNDAANLVRGEFESLTDRAEAGASTATEQAGVAAGHAEQAGEDRVQTGADRRQTGEDRAQTGEDREAAEGWASQSKDAATLAITAASAFEGHSPQQVIEAADRAEAASERVGTVAQIETWVGDVQEAADRVGSAEQVGQWVGEAEVLRDDTVAAAEHAETQAGIVDSKLDRAEAVATQMETFKIDFHEAPQDSGLFVVPSHGITPDPDNPGLYLIGA